MDQKGCTSGSETEEQQHCGKAAEDAGNEAGHYSGGCHSETGDKKGVRPLHVSEGGLSQEDDLQGKQEKNEAVDPVS